MIESSWRVAKASAIGTSHNHSGTPCQDVCECDFVASSSEQVLICIVCDGAGSALYSDIGARLCMETFLNCVKDFLHEGGEIIDIQRVLAEEWLDRIVQVLAHEASRQGHFLRDYASTLVAALIGGRASAFFQIGDGAIVVSQGADDGWSYVFWPQHGEFANSTNFVISANARDALEFEVAQHKISELALFSDGIENLVLHNATRSVHEKFFDAVFPPVRNAKSAGVDEKLSKALAKYLASKAVCDRTDDDKSLILATCRPENTQIT